MALTAVVQGLFILVIVLLYSGMVWRSLDQYFRDEFKKHLEQDKDYKKFKEQQNDNVDVMKEETQIEMFNSNIDLETIDTELDKQEGCRKEKHPSIKYKKQGTAEEYSDEMCPYTPP